MNSGVFQSVDIWLILISYPLPLQAMVFNTKQPASLPKETQGKFRRKWDYRKINVGHFWSRHWQSACWWRRRKEPCFTARYEDGHMFCVTCSKEGNLVVTLLSANNRTPWRWWWRTCGCAQSNCVKIMRGGSALRWFHPPSKCVYSHHWLCHSEWTKKLSNVQIFWHWTVLTFYMWLLTV